MSLRFLKSWLQGAEKMNRFKTNYHKILMNPSRPKSDDITPRACFLKCKGGVSALEFAILAPVMLVFVYAVLNFGIYYYYTSIVENSLFALSRAIIDPVKRPIDLAAAKALFNEEIGQLKTADLNGREVILSINPLTASSPAPKSNPTSVYKVSPGAPTVMRVVYPRPELINVDFLMDAWPAIFGNKIDITIMVEAK